MKYRVRLTREAADDLDRLYGFLIEHDLRAADHAAEAIEKALDLLAFAPFAHRRAPFAPNSRIRELVISFGRAGFVALFEIDDDETITVIAVRHQREEDYH